MHTVCTGATRCSPSGGGRAAITALNGRAATTFLVRAFVDIDRDPAEVVTAYRTSKIGKYWRKS
jgi:hypothetical protein